MRVKRKKPKRIDRSVRFGASRPDIKADVPFIKLPIGLRKRSWLLYKTSSGNVMDMALDMLTMHRDAIPLVPEVERREACGPCKGHNGGCPPYAPRLSKLAPQYQYALVMMLHIDMAWAIQYATPNTLPGKGRSRPFRHLRYADRLTDNLMHRIRAKTVDVLPKCLSLSLGNCEGCSSPKHCTVIQGGKCKSPKKRTFSVEAVGVDVDQLFYKHYGERLPWYMKSTYAIPTYMSRCIIFLLKEDPYDDPLLLTRIEAAIMDDKYLVGVGHRPFPEVIRPAIRKALIVEPNFKQMMWVYLDPPVEQHHNFKLVRKEAIREGKDQKVKAKKEGGRQKKQVKIKTRRKVKIKRNRRQR